MGNRKTGFITTPLNSKGRNATALTSCNMLEKPKIQEGAKELARAI